MRRGDAARMPNAALSAAYFAALLRQDWRCYASQLPRCAAVKTDTAAVAAETPLLPRYCHEWHCRCRGRNCRVALPRLALPLTRQKLPRCTAAGAAENAALCHAKDGCTAPVAALRTRQEWHCRWRGKNCRAALPLTRQKTTVAALRACQEWHSRRAPLSRHTNCRAHCR